MKIDIEDIKALEPGKIYPVTLDLFNMGAAQDMMDNLIEVGNEYDIRFIFFAKGIAELISAPAGMEVGTPVEKFRAFLQGLTEEEIEEIVKECQEEYQ